MQVTVASWFDKETLLKAKRVVGISAGSPPFANKKAKIWEFAPTWKIVNDLHDGTISQEEYKKSYLASLEGLLDVGIEKLQDGDVLCCWEKWKKGEKRPFCHRFILADALEERGIKVVRK